MKRIMFALGLLIGLSTVAHAAGEPAHLVNGVYRDVYTRSLTDENAYQLVKQDPTLTATVSAGLPASLATATTGRSDLVDMSGHESIALSLAWDTADSASVAFGVLIYNKVSGSWSDNDTPIGLPRLLTASPAAGDTTNALAFQIGGHPLHPTFYVFRSTSAPVAATYTLTDLASVPKIVPGPSGVTISLEGMGPWNYVGVQLVNCNANTVDSISGTWLVR